MELTGRFSLGITFAAPRIFGLAIIGAAMARLTSKRAAGRSKRGQRQPRDRRTISWLLRFLDYRADEWAKIDECVARAGKQTRLTNDQRIRLLKAAKTYQKAVIDSEHGTYAPLRKRREFFKKLQARFVQARHVLEKGASLFGSDWRATEFIWVEWKLISEISRRWFGELSAALAIDEMEGYLTIGNVLNLITAFEEAALFHHAEGFYHHYTATGRLDPRVVYFHKVLHAWWLVGGKTSLPTRDLRTGKLDNDLTRFFRAVVDPVMRDDAPSDESIPDIVKRQKLFEERFAGLPFSEEESAASTKDAPVQGKRDK
jgi:hypothetical protein